MFIFTASATLLGHGGTPDPLYRLPTCQAGHGPQLGLLSAQVSCCCLPACPGQQCLVPAACLACGVPEPPRIHACVGCAGCVWGVQETVSRHLQQFLQLRQQAVTSKMVQQAPNAMTPQGTHQAPSQCQTSRPTPTVAHKASTALHSAPRQPQQPTGHLLARASCSMLNRAHGRYSSSATQCQALHAR